jgi:spore coat protein U-like protein
MIKSLRVAAVISSLLVAVGSAQAGTTTTTFNVTATVLANCSVTANALNFGSYTPGAGALSGSTTVQVRCTRNTGYTVALNAGSTPSGALAQRLMKNASTADTLEYNLYTTNALTTVFGDGTGGSGTGAGTGNGMGATATSISVFGQLPDSTANQNAPTGSYSDTITVTVTY